MLEVPYDAILMVGFGGPEKPDDVIPFLENVLRGRNVPRARLLEVAEHYHHFGGVSPINGQMRDLIAAVRPELDRAGISLPIYWGNRNWHPLLPDTLRQMTDAGVKRSLAWVAAAYSSYSSCRQYREDLQRAQQAVGPSAPQIDKLRAFFNHPLFVTASAARLQAALGEFSPDELPFVEVAFTAHSIPLSMSRNCAYESQLRDTCRLTAEAIGLQSDRWQLVYQSRSGRPEDPWLAPDILDHLRSRKDAGARHLVIFPVGFLSDHMEVLYDLDCEAKDLADELGLRLVRAATVGTHPLFVRMIRELIEERLSGGTERATVGQLPPCLDVCAVDCCPAPQRPGPPAGASAHGDSTGKRST